MRKALFLDRDGTINKYGEYIHKKDDFIFIDGVIELIRFFKDMGYMIFVVTNQAGVARGYYTESDVVALHDWANEILSRHDAAVDEWVYCPHHPEHGIGELKKDCNCRKPKTGMVDYLCEKYEIDRTNSIMIGDKDWDIECGKRAGLKTFKLIDEDYNALFVEIRKFIGCKS